MDRRRTGHGRYGGSDQRVRSDERGRRRGRRRTRPRLLRPRRARRRRVRAPRLRPLLRRPGDRPGRAPRRPPGQHGSPARLLRWPRHERTSPAPRPAAVTAPTLVLWGESDRIATPAYGKEYAASFANARFEVVPEAGHLPHLEQPARTFALLDGFAAETGRR
ncbi:alpha/beta fold hydrolase [Streptomyces rishiriensis]|uniref:alpha/beta fold hydrolase n=1 Tax=Streptomyces rishiriensis TaxID=68264 RepID=UPI00358FA898